MSTFAEQLAGCKTFAELAESLPNKPTRATLWNWHQRGVDVNGQRIRLKAVKVGGFLVVTPQYWEEFLQACNPEPTILPESPIARARRVRGAKQALTQKLKGNSDGTDGSNNPGREVFAH